MEKGKALLECLLSADEGERVMAVANVLYQAEGYARALSLMCGGVAAKADPATARDLFAVQKSAEDVCDWLAAQWIPLFDHSTPAPAQTEAARPADTIH